MKGTGAGEGNNRGITRVFTSAQPAYKRNLRPVHCIDLAMEVCSVTVDRSRSRFAFLWEAEMSRLCCRLGSRPTRTIPAPTDERSAVCCGKSVHARAGVTAWVRGYCPTCLV